MKLSLFDGYQTLYYIQLQSYEIMLSNAYQAAGGVGVDEDAVLVARGDGVAEAAVGAGVGVRGRHGEEHALRREILAQLHLGTRYENMTLVF